MKRHFWLRGWDSWHAAYILTGLLAAVLPTGCTRAHYRRQADEEVYALLDRGTYDPRWGTKDFQIDLGPASRLYDPTCPDHPPMPPDDPESHRLMHCVDDKPGHFAWHINGDIPSVEYPAWTAYLPVDERGEVRLDLNGAVDLARLHSPDYQRQLETLYLSALDVTFERFRFDTQFFAGNDTFFTTQGEQRGGGNSRSNLTTDTDLQMRRLFPAGGELVVGFANNLMWQFSGPNTYSANSLIDFSFIQPLLRGGGRDVVMERLTLAERSLLSNLRAIERYRHEFYTEIAIGRNASTSPSRRGGVFGGAGLEGFAGVGGGFGSLGGGGGGGGAFGGGGGAGAAQAGGYLGLLQDQRQIENQRANVISLARNRNLLAEFFNAGRLDNRLQVDQASQALDDAISQLLNAEAAFESTLDTFKSNLGLPPDVPLVIQDDRLNQFELLHPDLIALQSQIDLLIDDLMPSPAASIDLADYRDALQRSLDVLERIREMHAAVVSKLPIVEEALAELQSQLPSRHRDLARLAAAQEAQGRIVEGTAWDVAVLDSHVQEIDAYYESVRSALLPDEANGPEGEEGAAITVPEAVDRLRPQLEAQIAQVEAQLALPEGDPNRLAGEELDRLLGDLEDSFNVAWELIGDLSAQASELNLTRARARLVSVVVPPNDLEPLQALQIASRNRLDWMNARASVVDSWRVIEFTADDLESDLDLVFSGDIGTINDNPFQFRDTTGQLRAGFQFDAPITRLSERNVYRQSLIEYQQARRSYISYVDGVHQGLRNILRTLELNQLNFEVRRQAVWTAVSQVDQAQLRLYRPPPPGEAATLGPTTARDVIDALSALQRVQNEFLSVWVNYEVQRLQLDLDLGTMRLDERGIWIDPGDVSAAAKAALDGGLPDDAPAELELEGIEPGRIEELPPAELRMNAPGDAPQAIDEAPIDGEDAVVDGEQAADGEDAVGSEERIGFPGEMFRPRQPALLPAANADGPLPPADTALDEEQPSDFEDADEAGTRLSLRIAPDTLDQGAQEAAHEERSNPLRSAEDRSELWGTGLRSFLPANSTRKR